MFQRHFERNRINDKKMKNIVIKKFIDLISNKHIIIFLDESGFQLTLNKRIGWRRRDEEYFCCQHKMVPKVHLLLTATRDQVIYYKITVKNTNSVIFQKLLTILLLSRIQTITLEKIMMKDELCFLWTIIKYMFPTIPKSTSEEAISRLYLKHPISGI